MEEVGRVNDYNYIDMVRLCNKTAWEIADRREKKMSDLISRQTVLMSLADYQLQESPNWGANGMGNTDAYEAITECIRVIEQAPAIDPVKHGKWIPINERAAKCSLCGEWEYTNGRDKTGTAIIHKAIKHYCPNCGARMDGDE